MTTLEELRLYHPKPAARTRAHIILLNNKNYSCVELVPIFDMTRQAIAATIKKWNKLGICGLFDKKRSGRTRKLSSKQEAIVIDMIHSTPRSLKTVLNKINKELDVTVSISTIKQLCKREGLS